MVELSNLEPGRGEQGLPVAEAPSVWDAGMGDALNHDPERLRILIARHQRHTGSARAAALLADWPTTVSQFVKVTPKDYRRALLERNAERAASALQAAE
jgi:glutamate synthase (NADPH/NADH) large chain